MTINTKNDWRLTPSLDAFIVLGIDNKIIYLAASEKKQYKLAVSKLIGTSSKEIHIDINEFEMKISLEHDDLSMFIRNPEALPDDSWYKVGNFGGNYFDYFLELSGNKGEFPGHTFEAVFSESSPTVVSFSSPGMKNYKAYFEEMKRRINCEVKRKTKKWVPGHRYDTLKETYYYLGEVMSRRADDKDSEFLTDDKMVPAYLYVRTINDGETTISDILNNRSFGADEDSIRVIYSLPYAGDSGAVLSGEISDFSKYWDALIKNAIKKNTVSDCFGYKRVGHIKDALDPLCYQTAGKLSYSSSPDDYKTSIRDLLFKSIYDIFICNWNIPSIRKDMNISSTNGEAENVQALEKSLYFYTEDVNSSRYAYYASFFKAIGIDIKDIISRSIACWDESDLSENFEEFIKNRDYFDLRKNQSAITSRQRVTSTPYKLDVTTLASIFGTGELTETLKKMVGFARENFGAGVTKYILYNIGTKKQPKEYESIEISLLDLVNWCGGPENVPSMLQKEIIATKFTRAFIAIDKDREVE